jgi:hypothetical protein
VPEARVERLPLADREPVQRYNQVVLRVVRIPRDGSVIS